MLGSHWGRISVLHCWYWAYWVDVSGNRRFWAGVYVMQTRKYTLKLELSVSNRVFRPWKLSRESRVPPTTPLLHLLSPVAISYWLAQWRWWGRQGPLKTSKTQDYQLTSTLVVHRGSSALALNPIPIINRLLTRIRVQATLVESSTSNEIQIYPRADTWL
jgi:hypothetical protein